MQNKFKYNRIKNGILRMFNVSYLIILVIACVSSYFLLNRGVILFDDGFFPFNPYITLISEISLFNYPYFLGAPYNYIFNYLPFTIFSVIIVNFLRLPYWVDFFLYLSGLQALGSIGMYRLVKKLSPTYVNGYFLSIGALLGSVFYMFSFNKMITINEFYPVLISFSLLPLLLSYLIEFYKDSKLNYKFLLYVAILSLVMASGYYEATFTFIIAIGILSFIFYSLLSFPGSRYLKFIKTIMLLLILVSTSIWVIPALIINTYVGFSNAPSTISGTYVLLNEINYNHGLSLLTLITFDYPLAGYSILPKVLGNGFNYYLEASVLLFISTQFFLFLPRNNPFKNIIKYFDTLIFGLFVLGIIDWPPQIFLYHFVFGVLFSVTVSWGFWIFQIWFSVIIGLSIAAFPYYKRENPTNEKIEEEKSNEIAKINKFLKRIIVPIKRYLPTLLLIALVLTYCVPIAAYEGMSTEQSVGYVDSTYHPSQSFIDTGNFLSQHSSQGNILQLPIIAGNYIINGSNKIWTVSDPLSTFTNSFIEYRDRAGVNNTLTYPILSDFQENPKGNISSYLSLYGIKYVVISKNENPGNYIVNYNESNYEELQKYFNNTVEFSYVVSFGNYTIFSLKNTNPLIYASNAYNQSYFIKNNSTLKLYNLFVNGVLNYKSESLFCGLKYNVTNVNENNVHVLWKKTSLNSYSIKINSNTTFALNFLKGYSTTWGSYHWVLKINGSQIDHKHYSTNLFANGWIMPGGNYTAEIYFSYTGLQNLSYVVSFVPIIVLLILPTAISIYKRKLINV